jgi:esterase/lipase
MCKGTVLDQANKNVLLVHGAFADGSGWEPVAKTQEKDGYTVSVAEPPETFCATAAVHSN